MIKTNSSSCISGFEFTPDNVVPSKGNLKVSFKGRKYIYQNVPVKVYENIKNCDSTGSAVCKLLRGKYTCYREL